MRLQSYPGYRADVDGLRALAVLAVIGFHAFPEWVGGGFIGVDIFFVISGFLIFGIIFKGLRGGSFSFSEFYARRIRRIFPALVIVLIACLAFGWIALFPMEYTSLGRIAAASAGFIANIALWREYGYFTTAAEFRPLLHLWSLGIEEQFYLTWPLLLMVLYRKTNKVFHVLCGLTLLSFIWNILVSTSNPKTAFYLPQTRCWELALGSLLAYITAFKGDIPALIAPRLGFERASIAQALAGLGVALFGAALFLIDKSRVFPGWWALLPTLAALFVIAAGPEAWFNRKILSVPCIVFVGLISYPLYLWHWPLCSFVRIIENKPPGIGIRIVVTAAAFALAWVTYRLVEVPVRFGVGRKVYKVAALCALMGTVFVMAGAISQQIIEKKVPPDAKLQNILAAMVDWDYPGFLKPLPAGKYRIYYQNSLSDKRVLFWGDSNIEQYAPRISSLINENPDRYKSVLFATCGGCVPMPDVREGNNHLCSDFVDNVFRLTNAPDVDAIVIGAAWKLYFPVPDAKKSAVSYHYYGQDGSVDDIIIGSDGARKALKSFEAMLTELSKTKKVFLVLSVPSGKGVNPANLIERSVVANSSKIREGGIRKEEFLTGYSWLQNKLKEIAVRANVTIIDPLDFLCDNTFCKAVLPDGRPIYKDGAHLRPFFVKERVRYLDEAMEIEGTIITGKTAPSTPSSLKMEGVSP